MFLSVALSGTPPSTALRLSHKISLLPGCGTPKDLDGLPTLSKKGAAVTADSPKTTLDALIDCNTKRIRHLSDL